MTRWVVITGAAGGIGQELVKIFSSDGYRVIGIDCVQQPTELICTHYLHVDLEHTVNDEAYANNIFMQIRGLLGKDGLHALINNAALQILGGVDSLTRQDWQKTLNINLIATFIWVQGLLSELEMVNGAVVNISSIHAKLTKKNFVAYSTSKAALSGLTRALAVDVGDRIRINAIEPAAIDTKMLRAGFQNHSDSFEELIKCHPQKRIGRPSEVAHLALALTKPEMKFLHGECISVTGGIDLRLHDPI